MNSKMEFHNIPEFRLSTAFGENWMNNKHKFIDIVLNIIQMNISWHKITKSDEYILANAKVRIECKYVQNISTI